MPDLKRQANEAAGRYTLARAEYVRLDEEVAALERNVTALERRTASLRQATTPPAVIPSSFACPINGPVAFSADFGGRRGHRGNDLLSPRGTENVAVVAGTIESRIWGAGGLTIFLTGDDGNTYVYMHLLSVVGPQPRHVAQGEVVGLTGASGNATAYHTHFEFHPGGGPAVDPYPLISAHC